MKDSIELGMVSSRKEREHEETLFPITTLELSKNLNYENLALNKVKIKNRYYIFKYVYMYGLLTGK